MAMTLENATIEASGDGVATTFTWSGVVPQDRTVLWSVTVVSHDGGIVRQLGYKLIPGDRPVRYVFDFHANRQANLDPEAHLRDQELRATFPASALDGLGDDWRWHATLTIDGADVGRVG